MMVRVSPSSFSGETKTLLGGSEIENKISSVVLAAYSRGRLYRCATYTGNGSSMPLRLENGESYTVYALVNMGDCSSLFPEYESGIDAISYSLTSYNQGANSVLNRGIPMAGSATFTAGNNTHDIPVRRLLAKVTVHFSCTWPGSTIENGTIYNMNGRLVPFGSSAIASSQDAFSFAPEKHVCGGDSPTGDLVFYIPENMQGNMAGIDSSSKKNHQESAAIDSRKDFLTYMEVKVSGSGLYDGEITYRSYLGANSTDNFDIRGNCSYIWNITCTEDNLSTDSWKVDNSLEDLRTLAAHGPIFASPGETVRLSDYITTNMPLSTIGWDISADFLREDLIGEVVTGSSLNGPSFIVDNSRSPLQYGNRIIGIKPVSNPRAGLGGYIPIYVIDESISWQNTLSGSVYNMKTNKTGIGDKYFATPGKSVEASVDYSVTYMDDTLGEQVFIPLKGKGGDRWTWTDYKLSGISSDLLGDLGKDYEQIEYSVQPTTIPGDYPIEAASAVKAQVKATAFVHVNDTRSIQWYNRSSSVPSSNGFIAYRYLSENKIVVILTPGGAYSTSSGSGFTSSNSPFLFVAGDRSTRVADLSNLYYGVPFEGNLLLSNNYQNRIALAFSGPMSIKSMTNRSQLSKKLSGNLIMVPNITQDLADGSTYTIKVKAKNGYDDATSHEIEAIVRTGSGNLLELAITPAISRVNVGASITFTPTLYSFVVTDNVLTTDSSTILARNNPVLHWSSEAPGGVFVATAPGNYRISATFNSTTTAYADIEVCNSDMDMSGDWESGDSITLD